MTSLPFWQEKSLDNMTDQEWESLCDGCGRCCLHKLIDGKTNEIYFTNNISRYATAKSVNPLAA